MPVSEIEREELAFFDGGVVGDVEIGLGVAVIAGFQAEADGAGVVEGDGGGEVEVMGPDAGVAEIGDQALAEVVGIGEVVGGGFVDIEGGAHGDGMGFDFKMQAIEQAATIEAVASEPFADDPANLTEGLAAENEFVRPAIAFAGEDSGSAEAEGQGETGP